jgi:hypothetical protein
MRLAPATQAQQFTPASTPPSTPTTPFHSCCSMAGVNKYPRGSTLTISSHCPFDLTCHAQLCTNGLDPPWGRSGGSQEVARFTYYNFDGLFSVNLDRCLFRRMMHGDFTKAVARSRKVALPSGPSKVSPWTFTVTASARGTVQRYV